MSDAIQTAILAAFSAALERAISQAVATHVQDLQTRLDDLADRTAELESAQLLVQAAALAERIAKLENNPAQGVDSEWDIGRLEQRITALESETQGENRYLNREDVASLIEEAMDAHLEGYDHDSYDSAVSTVEDVDFDDLVTKDDVGEAVREALDGLSVTLSL